MLAEASQLETRGLHHPLARPRRKLLEYLRAVHHVTNGGVEPMRGKGAWSKHPSALATSLGFIAAASISISTS
jgi:hypothetical protein